MKVGSVLLGLFLVFCTNINLTLAQEAQVKDLYIELILDASNSMNEPLGGTKKIDIAKQALNEVLNDLSPDTYLALRVYGSDITKLSISPGQTKEDAVKAACTDSVLKTGFAKGNITNIKQIINTAEAVGYTPIAYSLELAGEDFKGISGNNYIILASDGKETCAGDPIAVVNALKSKGINVVVHTIGFAVDEEARQQLQDIAKAGGGNYYSADTAEQLKESFKKVIEVIGKEEELFKAKGKEVIPGTGFENATLIEAGEYYLRNLAISEKYKHTVKVNAVRGQRIDFSVMFTPADNLGGMHYVYVNAYDKDLQKVYSDFKGPSTELEPKTIGFWAAPDEEETYYLVFIGTQWEKFYLSNIMNVYLKVDIENRFDGGSSKDAPYPFPQALEISPGNYDSNWIFPENDADKYTMGLGQGETLSVKIFPTEDWGAELTIYNEDREETAKSLSKNKGAVAKEKYTSSEGEKVYINVEKSTGLYDGKYEMEIEVTKVKEEPQPAQ